MRGVDGDQSTVPDRLSLDVVHDLLAARRRRYVLYSLYLYATPVRLPDVADRVAELEDGPPVEELTEERTRTYLDLYHTHVPKLADAGVVSYSQSGDEVELASTVSQLRPYLELTAESDLNATDAESL